LLLWLVQAGGGWHRHRKREVLLLRGLLLLLLLLQLLLLGLLLRLLLALQLQLVLLLLVLLLLLILNLLLLLLLVHLQLLLRRLLLLQALLRQALLLLLLLLLLLHLELLQLLLAQGGGFGRGLLRRVGGLHHRGGLRLRVIDLPWRRIHWLAGRRGVGRGGAGGRAQIGVGRRRGQPGRAGDIAGRCRAIGRGHGAWRRVDRGRLGHVAWRGGIDGGSGRGNDVGGRADRLRDRCVGLRGQARGARNVARRGGWCAIDRGGGWRARGGQAWGTRRYSPARPARERILATCRPGARYTAGW